MEPEPGTTQAPENAGYISTRLIMDTHSGTDTDIIKIIKLDL